MLLKQRPLSDWLPITKKEVESRGWEELDVILITGDAYVDHPSFGAAVIGKLNDKYKKNNLIIFSTLLMMISWGVFYFSESLLIGLAVGVILVDLGLQVLHITNQVIIFSKNPEARNRVNTVYMVGFFIGGALGTFLGAFAWENYGWKGVSLLGFLISAMIYSSNLFKEIKCLMRFVPI